MANITKLALEAALKKELLTKPLDKITINDLAEDCGISRMAFLLSFQRYLRSGRVGMCGGRHEGTAGEEEL